MANFFSLAISRLKMIFYYFYQFNVEDRGLKAFRKVTNDDKPTV